MGASGTAMAANAADIILMNENLLLVPWTIELATKTINIILENVAFSIAVKVAAIVFAVAGMSPSPWIYFQSDPTLLCILVGTLTFWQAVLIDIGTLVVVVLNSLRVLCFKSPRIA
jgi:Cd2+/Zn2+-exporting ATPase